MGYTVRFESSAFQADSNIRKLIDFTSGLKRQLGAIAGVKVEDRDIDKLRKLYGVNERVFIEAMNWADQDFDQQITNSQWQWKGADGITRRKNGQIVTEPRDIVDTGALLSSKERRSAGRGNVEFEWTAPHAEGVHDGYSSKSGQRVPARPWTEPTLEDVDTVIQELLDRETR